MFRLAGGSVNRQWFLRSVTLPVESNECMETALSQVTAVYAEDHSACVNSLSGEYHAVAINDYYLGGS